MDGSTEVSTGVQMSPAQRAIKVKPNPEKAGLE